MASSERRMLPSLPFELIEEILYRTPAESLLRFKSTCKKWYALITDKKFIYNHLDHSPERFIRYQTSHVIDPVTGIVSDSPIPDELNPHRTSYMIHCDGLMLCKCADPDQERRMICSILSVWNPALRKIKWIAPSVCYWNSNYFGIGYANTCRDNYKILSFSDPSILRYRKYEIYEFNSEWWRSIDAGFDGEVDTECEGVSVNGDMYWIAVKNKVEGSIQSFDFSMETFKFICPCDYYWNRRLGCFNGDRLSLFQQEEDSGEIHLSVTNKLSDRSVSFTRYFNVTSPDLPELQSQDTIARQGYSIGKHRINIAWCEGISEEDRKWYTFITLFEIDQDGIRKETEIGRCEAPGSYDPLKPSYVYIPSLIPVPE